MSFASADEGAAILASEDAFTKRLSPFDLQARMRLDAPPLAGAFAAFVGEAAVDWPAEERRHLLESWKRLLPKLVELGVQLPDEPITFIRTDGKEEPGSAYTRATSIIFHPGSVSAGAGLDGLLAHELFHVISRSDRKLRDQLYAIIGFTFCGEVELPESLALRKITNPDAPANQHSITLEIDGKARAALPILVAARAFDPGRKEGLMSYLMLQFLVIEKKSGRWVAAETEDGSPAVASRLRVKKFAEQIGENTGYIIHPEEILAENFRHLILATKSLPNPEIVEKMRAVFAEAKR